MISHRHKCIFIHIPKTAGTSLNTFFHPGVSFHYAKPDYERLFGWCPKRKLHMQHATANQLLETGLITEEVWNSYYKFTFVRNPWDRAYSDFLWIQNFTRIEGKFSDFLQRRGVFKKILTDNSTNRFLGDHLLAQSKFFSPIGNYKMDFVGRFENLKEDVVRILDALSINKPFNEFQNRGNRSRNYSNFYTKTSQNLIAEKYSEDIMRFSYCFENKRTGFNVLKQFL